MLERLLLGERGRVEVRCGDLAFGELTLAHEDRKVTDPSPIVVAAASGVLYVKGALTGAALMLPPPSVHRVVDSARIWQYGP